MEWLGNGGRRTRLLRSLIYLIGHLAMTSTFDCSLARALSSGLIFPADRATLPDLCFSPPRFFKREGIRARGVSLRGVSLDTGSRDEGSAAIGSFEEKNTASAISPLVVSHVCRTARSFVFVHFAHPVSEKTLRRLFVTKAQPQITCSGRNSRAALSPSPNCFSRARARASATNPLPPPGPRPPSTPRGYI
jgi:hypothetical protein